MTFCFTKTCGGGKWIGLVLLEMEKREPFSLPYILSIISCSWPQQGKDEVSMHPCLFSQLWLIKLSHYLFILNKGVNWKAHKNYLISSKNKFVFSSCPTYTQNYWMEIPYCQDFNYMFWRQFYLELSREYYCWKAGNYCFPCGNLLLRKDKFVDSSGHKMHIKKLLVLIQFKLLMKGFEIYAGHKLQSLKPLMFFSVMKRYLRNRTEQSSRSQFYEDVHDTFDYTNFS